MFKKVLFLLVFLSFTQSSFAQKSAIDKAADKMCELIKKEMDTVKNLNKADAQTFFVKAFGKVCATDLDALMKEIGEKKLNKENGQKLGYKIGLKLAEICPEYMVLIHKATEGSAEETTENKTNFTITGTVESTTTTNYTFVSVNDENNKVVKLVWLENFEGADKVNNNPDKLIGKYVTLKYEHKDLYDKRTNSFRTEKVITYLTTD